MKHHPIRTTFVLAAMLAVLALSTSPVMAASPVTHLRDSVHRFEHTEHFSEDICGPRATTETFVTTFTFHQITKGDTIHLQFMETGSHSVIFDDPTIPSLYGHFTDAVHWNRTAGETETFIEMFHDFIGDIHIQYRYHITIVGDEIQVEQEFFSVSGCP